MATNYQLGRGALRPKLASKVIRLVTIDVDGTLLDSSSSLPPTVREAVNELDARGVGVVLATARSPAALRVVLRELHFVPWLICFSGAWIGELELRSLTSQRAWWEKRHSASVARWIVETALANNVEPNVYGLETWRVRTLTREILAESQITNTRPTIAAEVLDQNEEPYKILLVTGEDVATARLHDIAKLVQSRSTATFSKPNYLEIIPLGVNKARSLATLAQLKGIELSQVAAIGDGLNDLEMPQEAGIGIAMGNAAQEVISAADWITATNDEGGVAHAVRKLINEDLI